MGYDSSGLEHSQVLRIGVARAQRSSFLSLFEHKRLRNVMHAYLACFHRLYSECFIIAAAPYLGSAIRILGSLFNTNPSYF